MEIAYIATKHYIEMYVPTTTGGVGTNFKTSVTQVADRDPLIFDNEDNASIIAGFRFFDVRTAVISEEPGEEDKIVGEREKYSPIFYWGKRMTVDDIQGLPISSWLLTLMKIENSNSAILCDCGCIITNPEEGSMTIEEYKKLNPSNKTPGQTKILK